MTALAVVIFLSVLPASAQTGIVSPPALYSVRGNSKQYLCATPSASALSAAARKVELGPDYSGVNWKIISATLSKNSREVLFVASITSSGFYGSGGHWFYSFVVNRATGHTRAIGNMYFGVVSGITTTADRQYGAFAENQRENAAIYVVDLQTFKVGKLLFPNQDNEKVKLILYQNVSGLSWVSGKPVLSARVSSWQHEHGEKQARVQTKRWALKTKDNGVAFSLVDYPGTRIQKSDARRSVQAQMVSFIQKHKITVSLQSK